MWTDECELILTALKGSTGIPYFFERYEEDEDNPQLPDTYIVYFLVDDNGKAWTDGNETAHEPRIQVSLFYRDKSMFKTIPTNIEAAFMTTNFMRVGSGRIPYQNDTGHYGWRCDFRFYEKR